MPLITRIKKDRYYLLLFLVPFLYMVVFRVLPIAGNLIAFRRYRPGGSLFGQAWSGFQYFRLFLSDHSFWMAFRNSFVLSVLCLVVNFPIPIVFALLLNEVGSKLFKRITQTISYLPRFIASVVVVGMLREILSPDTGVVNLLIGLLGGKPIYFLIEPSWYRAIYVFSDTWQYTGWNAIIYLAALTTINVELYDAASIDGAGRFKQTLHVTIPGIMPTVTVVLLISVGYFLSRGYEKALLLYTPSNSATGDIIETFVYRLGLVQNSYSYSAAVALFSSILAIFLLYTTNALSRKFSDTSLF